jgi:hypothetical protein
VALPLVVAFHPGYTFPFAVCAFVLAGHGVATVYELLRPRGATLAAAWVLAACGLNLPSVASYYRDGSRYDYRTVAIYVRDHFRPGDHVVAVSPALLRHYAAECRDAVKLPSDPLPTLRALGSPPGRTWVVIPSGRGGKDEGLGRWLARHCSQELAVRKTRFDYYDYTVELFLYSTDDVAQ